MAIKSAIVEDMSLCWVCKRPREHIHHILYGTSNRKIADKYGYIIPLCAEHHTGANGVHFNKGMELYLKRMAQEHFEEHHGTREDFIRVFGKSYL